MDEYSPYVFGLEVVLLIAQRGRFRVERAGEILNLYARRWAVECTFKALKSGLRWGQMQVTKEKE